MISMRYLAVAGFLGVLAGAGCDREHAASATGGQGSGGGPVTVHALEERLRAAILAGDTAALGSLLAPEYLSTSAVGHTSNRTESLAAYGTGLVKVDSAAVRDLDVRTYGETAVSLGYMDWVGSAAGMPFAGSARFQHVWVRGDSGWRLVASQLTNQGSSGGRPASVRR